MRDLGIRCEIVEADFVDSTGVMIYVQEYFKPEEVPACIVTCGGLCRGINTVILWSW